MGGVKRDFAQRPPFRIFISYRREDTSAYTRLLFDALTARWPGADQIFWDIDRIAAGVDFTEAIDRAVSRCDVLVAVIGTNWLTVADPATGAPRLDDPEDYVRLEIESALVRDDVRVIPVLVAGAEMPSPANLPSTLASLTRRNAVSVSDSHWEYDIERLLAALQRIELETADERVIEEAHEPPSPARDTGPTGLAGGAVADATGQVSGRRRVASRVRRHKRGVAAVVALLVAGGSAGTIAVVRGGGSSDQMKLSGGTMGGPVTDAIESELILAHVPDSLRALCQSTSPVSAGTFVRAVRCVTRDGYTVEYDRALSGDVMSSYFLSRVAKSRIAFPTTQTCGSGRPAAGEWIRVGLVGHAEQRSHQAGGRLLCFTQGGRAFIAWTDTPTKIYAIASAAVANRPGLYNWWQGNAGPETMRAHVMPELGPYPDSIESELLLAHLPAAVRKHCRRGINPEEQVFLRSLACAQGKDMVSYSYAHSGIAMRVYFANRATAEGVEYPTKTPCINGGSAGYRWVFDGPSKSETAMRDSTGDILCFERDGRYFLEWTSIPDLIYASTSRPVSEHDALYSWWTKDSGPIASPKADGERPNAETRTYSFESKLTAPQEVPTPTAPIGATGSFGAKTTEITSGWTFSWKLTFHGLSGEVLAAHIHLGSRGQAGDVLIALCGPCRSGQNGTLEISSATETAMKNGGAYVNVHTARNPGGEVRGQVMIAGK